MRQRTTPKNQAIQTVCETQLRRRIEHGHPIPQVQWVKGHALEQPTSGITTEKLADYEFNRRADALCTAALNKNPPSIYRLMGQPDHYLYTLDNGKPLAHGPRHHVKAQTSKRYLSRMQHHRRQGQLIRGNTSLPMVAAASKYLGRTARMRPQDNMLTRSITQQLPTRSEMARRGDRSAHWLTEDEATCSACESPHALDAPHLVTCAKMRQVWDKTRNKILKGIKKEKALHRNKSEKSTAKTINIPDKFPEKRGGKRVLRFLDPLYERDYDLHGTTNPLHPELKPRELPCPRLTAQIRPKKGATATVDDIRVAYESLNATNPIRTCLGAPPKELPALLSLLGANTKTIHDIWAKLFAPHLMSAVSQCLTIQNSECGQIVCDIPDCLRCESDESDKPRRKKRKLNPGVFAIDNASTR